MLGGAFVSLQIHQVQHVGHVASAFSTCSQEQHTSQAEGASHCIRRPAGKQSQCWQSYAGVAATGTFVGAVLLRTVRLRRELLSGKSSLTSGVRRRPTVRALKEKHKGSAAVVLQDVAFGKEPCALTRLPLPACLDSIDGWLRDWQYHPQSTPGAGGDAGYWRQRSIMAMTRQLDLASGRDTSGGRGLGPWEEAQAKKAPPLEVYALHRKAAAEDGASEAPLALAFTSQRQFPVGNAPTLHLDNVVSNPEAVATSRGCGAELLGALVVLANETGKILTVEPQSEELEKYFSNLGFQAAPGIDQFLWFFVGGGVASVGWPKPSAQLELRFPLQGLDDRDRLQEAFKRPPIRLTSSEEMYIARRQDTAAMNILAIRVKSARDGGASRSASLAHFSRDAAGRGYVPKSAAPVDMVEAMGAMRNPALLAELDWPMIESCLGEGSSSPSNTADDRQLPGPDLAAAAGSFVVVGRCSILQRVYPLPGLASIGAEVVLEALELPMSREPVCSVAITSTVDMLAVAVDAAKDFLGSFGIRASFHPSGEAWNLEVVSSEGLIASMLEPSTIMEEDDDDIFE